MSVTGPYGVTTSLHDHLKLELYFVIDLEDIVFPKATLCPVPLRADNSTNLQAGLSLLKAASLPAAQNNKCLTS